MNTDTQAPIPPEVERELHALTTWPGEKTELWKSALAASTPPGLVTTRRRMIRIVATTLAAAALIFLAMSALLPTLGNARSSVGRIAFDSGFAPPTASMPETSQSYHQSGTPKYSLPAIDVRPDAATGFAEKKTDQRETDHVDVRAQVEAPARQVIRKATIELAVPDTRDAFAKCQHLLRADLSEFVEGSTLTGQGQDARAQLTLRVAASRISEVLNELRTLGKVDSENATGDDVTAQAVDLDATLRNERAVETEILYLLETRKDAQLKDILELREKLASVRQGIERLQGRRDTLARQVALASILVIIRPDDAPKKDPKPASILDRFSDETSAAWTSGLTALTQTIAFLIRIAVGGLIWWLLLIAAIYIARRLIRRLIPDPAAVPVGL